MKLHQVLQDLEKNYPCIGFDDDTTRDPVYLTAAQFAITVPLLLDYEVQWELLPIFHKPRHGQTVGVIRFVGRDDTLPLVWNDQPKQKRYILLMLDRNEQVLDMIHIPIGSNEEEMADRYITAIRQNPATNITMVRIMQMRKELSV